MIRAFFRSRTVLKASIILAIFSFLADLVALLRDRILAAHFGASRALDIYYSAFKIPDFVFNLLVLGAVSSAFIPVFIEYYRTDQAKAWRLAQNFLTVVFSGILIVSSVIFVFARPLSYLIAPGFVGDDRDLVILLTRVMLLSPIIFSLSTVFGSILQSLERFLTYAVAPVLYNIGIVIGAVIFVPIAAQHGYPEIIGLGCGVILGALLHFLVQLPAVIKAGFRFKIIYNFADTGLRRITRLMIPRTIGLAVYGINSIVDNAVASTMAAGSIVAFNLANNLQFVPIAVVGVSVATAVFPRLSAHASEGELDQFKMKLHATLRNTGILVGAVAVGMFLFRHLIIQILLGVGALSGAGIDRVASVLGILMVGVVAQSLIPIMSRAFYALQNTKTPVIISVVSIGTNVLLSLLFGLYFQMGPAGLAWSFSIAGNVNFLLLYIAFQKRYSL